MILKSIYLILFIIYYFHLLYYLNNLLSEYIKLNL